MNQEQQSKYVEMMQLLTMNDYIARKVVFELAENFKKLFPDTPTPEYDKYKDVEEKAKEFRKIIEDIQDDIQ